MLIHDLVAELAGYKRELAARGDDDSNAAAIREEILRVERVLREKAEALEAEASELEDNGQDVLAARHRVEARRLAEPLEDAAEARPRQRAVPKHRSSAGSSS